MRCGAYEGLRRVILRPSDTGIQWGRVAAKRPGPLHRDTQTIQTPTCSCMSRLHLIRVRLPEHADKMSGLNKIGQIYDQESTQKRGIEEDSHL